MKLLELRPRFLRYSVEISDGTWRDGVLTPAGGLIEIFAHVATLAEAHGIWFDCPLCTQLDKAHGVICWFPHAPLHPNTDLGKNNAGVAVRWPATGNDFSDLTLSPSIQIQGGCNWHGFIEHGESRNA